MMPTDPSLAPLLARLQSAQAVLTQCVKEADTSHGNYPFLYDTMSLVQAKKVLSDLGDVEALLAAQQEQLDRLKARDIRLQEQLATRTEALDRKMDLAVEAELEIRRATVQEAIKPFIARAEQAEADVERLTALLRESRREHYHCEDSAYCCPKCMHPDHSGEPSDLAECECGADAWNARVDAALIAEADMRTEATHHRVR